MQNPAETKLYYLQSRYYDPAIGRFINADSLVSTGQGILGNNMFAYCNNNPVNYIDPSGCLGFDVATTSFGDADWGQQTSAFLDAIYSKIDGVINGQGVFEFSNYKFGLGSYAKNGCGSIAVYNALQLLGHSVSLSMVTDQFIHNGSLLLGGLLGVSPWAVDDVLAEHGIKSTGYWSYWELEQNLSNNDIIIFLVLNNASNIFDGAHYMTAQYMDGQYVVYNMYNDWAKTVNVNSLMQPYGKSGFMYGFIIGALESMP